jgi:hypothetical protein
MARTRGWRRELRQNTEAFLESLGETPVQIAANLERSGVRATPRDSGDCAIAVFLHATLATHPTVHAVTVTGTEVILSPTRRRHRVMRVRLSEPLRRFVCSFDYGAFPQLTRAPGADTTTTTDPLDI